MNSLTFKKILIVLAMGLLVFALIPETADASMRGRRGGVHRGGHARSGSVNHNRARSSGRSSSRNRGNARNNRGNARDNRRDVGDNRRDAADDRRDMRRHVARHDARVRRHRTARWVNSLTDCVDREKIVVDNVTYYHCDDVWYERVVQDGDVIFGVVDVPEGY